MKTKVYWCTEGKKFQHLCDYGIEPLSKEIKTNSFFKENHTNHYSAIKTCPALMQAIKNTYVIKSPYNLLVRRDRYNNTISAAIVPDFKKDYEIHPELIYNSLESHIQMHMLFYHVFFSEKSINLTMTPPYLHPNTYPGVSGAYDISKWYRSISPAYLFPNSLDEFRIKAGEACMYISFNKPVELIRHAETEYTKYIADSLASYKNIKSKTPLSVLYDMFNRSKINKRLIKEIKDNIL